MAEVATHRTNDGGVTWSTVRQTAGLGLGAYAGGSLLVHSSETAWLVARAQTSSAGSSAVLLRTTDGGASWSTFDLPVAGSIQFLTASHGWLAGGPVANRLYETRDGGETWVTRSLPAGIERSPMTTITSPHFFTPTSGILPVQEQRESGGSMLRFFSTNDGGQSWIARGTPIDVRRGGSIFDGDFSLASFVGEKNWYVVADALLVTRDGGESYSEVRSNQDLTNVAQISFATVDDGWVKLTMNACSGTRANAEHRPSSACPTNTRVLRTSDGGTTWVEQPLA